MAEVGRAGPPTFRAEAMSRNIARPIDPAKLAAFHRALEQAPPDERYACQARLVRADTYDQIALDLGSPSVVQAREAVTRGVDRVLRSVVGATPSTSLRLADLLGPEHADDALLGAGAPIDMSPEEEAVLRELIALARQGPPLTAWGKFADLEVIDAGGFGTVFSARDPALQTRVALKLYHPHRSKRPGEELLGEARKLARIRHDNVVRVYGADEIDGRVGVWMELIEGATLEEEVRGGARLDSAEAADVGIALCEALSAVHAAGVVHGDIKSTNVMRGHDGRVVLMDFGAARSRNPTTFEGHETRAGTPAYMAPELFVTNGARLAEPTVQSDVYAVGVLLFYLVTGKCPVEGESAADYQAAHAQGAQMRLLADERPDLRESFVRVVEQALARSPDQRWLSVAEMGQELRASKPHAAPAVTMTRLWHAGQVAATVVFAIAVLGFLETRSLELTLNIPPDFFLRPPGYLAAGASALAPFVAQWIIAGLGFGLLLGLVHAARRVFPRHVEPVWGRWSLRLGALGPKTTAASVLLLGVLALVAMTWAFYGPLMRPTLALHANLTDASMNFAIFNVALRDVHQYWVACAAGLSFVLGIGCWRWFPSLERRVGDASTVRMIRFAIIGVAFIAVAMTMTPRGLLWEQFEIAEFQGRELYVVRATEDEYLLYDPESRDRTLQRVRHRDTAVRLTGSSRSLVEHAESQR